MRAVVAKQRDPDLSQGLAFPYYEKMLALPEGTVNNSRKVAAYQDYIVYYANIKHDIKTAKRYGQKLIEISPENSLAKQIIDYGK